MCGSLYLRERLRDPDSLRAERKDYREVVLLGRLREKLTTFNPNIPAAAIEDSLISIHRIGVRQLLKHSPRRASRSSSAYTLGDDHWETLFSDG